jgi:hypothetical protein
VEKYVQKKWNKCLTKSPLFLPMMALSMDVLVEIIHKSAVVLDTNERDTRSMKRDSEVKKPGRTTFTKDIRRLKNTMFTATFSPFLLNELRGEGAGEGCGALR